MSYKVEVDQRKCKGCEECLEACSVQVFKMEGGKSIPVNAVQCVGCESCVQICEEKAITVVEMERDLSETARLLLRDIW